VNELHPTLTITPAFRDLVNRQVSSCCYLADHHAKMRMRFFSKGWAKEIPEPIHASLFKHVVLFAFQLNFPKGLIVDVCRGVEILSPLTKNEFTNFVSDIAEGKSNKERVEDILSNYYKIPDLVFDEPKKHKNNFWGLFIRN